MIPAARRLAALAFFAAFIVGEASAQRVVMPRRAGPLGPSPAGWRANAPGAVRGMNLGSISALRPSLPGASAAPALGAGLAPAPALNLKTPAGVEAAPQAQPLDLLGREVSEALGAADLSRAPESQAKGTGEKLIDLMTGAKSAEIRPEDSSSPFPYKSAVTGPLFFKGPVARPAGGDLRPPAPRPAATSKRSELLGKVLVGGFFGAAAVAGVVLGTQAPWWASGLVFLGGGTVLGATAALALGAVVLSVVFALVGFGVVEPKAGPVRTALAAAGLFALTAGGVGLATAGALKALGFLGFAPLAAAGMLKPRSMPNPADQYSEAHKAAARLFQDKGVDPAGMKFSGVNGSLARPKSWTFEFRAKEGGREDLAAVSYSPNVVSGFDRKELYYRGVGIETPDQDRVIRTLDPYYFGRGSLTTPARAADAARAALPGFRPETFSLDLREEAVSGDQDLQYTFYSDNGSVVRVNARTGASLVLERPEAPRRAVRPWEAASAMAFASLLIVGGALALLAVVIRVIVGLWR